MAHLPRRTICQLAAAASSLPLQAPLRCGFAGLDPTTTRTDLGTCEQPGEEQDTFKVAATPSADGLTRGSTASPLRLGPAAVHCRAGLDGPSMLTDLRVRARVPDQNGVTSQR